jgi:hypothetical protein
MLELRPPGRCDRSKTYQGAEISWNSLAWGDSWAEQRLSAVQRLHPNPKLRWVRDFHLLAMKCALGAAEHHRYEYASLD